MGESWWNKTNLNTKILFQLLVQCLFYGRNIQNYRFILRYRLFQDFHSVTIEWHDFMADSTFTLYGSFLFSDSYAYYMQNFQVLGISLLQNIFF